MFLSQAKKNVRRRWVEQGIWNGRWDEDAFGRWKHEEPLESETETETETDSETGSKEPKSINEKKKIAWQQMVQNYQREASRPYHQFVYQVSKERERIQGESPDWISTDVMKINTKAYENVKAFWTEQRIWDARWGILPGMAWKHELPFDEKAVDNPMAIEASPLVNSGHVGEIPTRTMSEFSSVDKSHPHPPLSSPIHHSRRGPSRHHNNLFNPTNGDAETCISPRPQTSKRALRSATGQVSRPNKRNQSPKDGQTQPVASTSLDPVSPSRLSEVTGKKRQLPSVLTDSADQPLLYDPDREGPLPQDIFIPSDRSKRLMKENFDEIQASTGVPGTDSLGNNSPGVRPKRKVAGSSKSAGSAKPQGVSKNLRSSRTQGKGKKR